ncbi:MAG: hypothetical protein ABFS42_07350 [Candidatus Krumholzibacteriota bacterium]
MKTNQMIKFGTALCLLGLMAGQGLARNSIANDWRNFYPNSCQTLQDATTNGQSCILCHTAGFGLNPYAQDLLNADLNFAAIESLDSDGDGRTNGEEINVDCSLPGDPVSPVDNDSWGGIKVLFR